MDSEIRIAMMQATEERRELGHDLLGPDHLLLGLLANVRGSAYEVLAGQGVTYDWVRQVVAEKHDDRREDDDADEPTDSSDNLDEDKEALKAIGIDLDKVREAVRDAFGEDITERWGQRRGRGRGERGHHSDGDRRGRDEERKDRDERRGGPRRGGPHGRGPWGGEFEGFGEGFAGFGPGGRGRRGPRSRRFERVTASMRRMLHGLRGELRAAQTEQGCDRSTGLLPGVVLAAIFASHDAAVDAVIEAADNPDALRVAVDALAGHATT
ncbi:Clp protease N-terminal domain-containing protein [Flexivirga alba]|uniref:Clp protease N-terminal domain-containing protein n=1 Tax=Flexivirga alba TaxID=702742 RepID=A0ABW2AD01_9MICO